MSASDHASIDALRQRFARVNDLDTIAELTGDPIMVDRHVRHLTAKLSDVYGVEL